MNEATRSVGSQHQGRVGECVSDAWKSVGIHKREGLVRRRVHYLTYDVQGPLGKDGSPGQHGADTVKDIGGLRAPIEVEGIRMGKDQRWVRCQSGLALGYKMVPIWTGTV